MEHSTNSIGEVRITLRDDIRFRPQQYGGETSYVIEDPATSSFYRIGVPEYTLISLLDGKNSISDAMHHASSVLGRDAFTEHDAASISRWLVECGLAKTNTSDESNRWHQKSDERRSQTLQQWLNPLVTKIPLFCPERLIDRVSPWLMWTTTPLMLLVWIGAIGLAAHQLITHGNKIAVNFSEVLTPHNWIWLGAIWLILKLVHESYHALFCRKYGGEVREAGVVLIAFAPIFYVDVTSSWRFASKWQRIMIAAAGMCAEIFIGAIAAIVWVRTDPGVLNQIAFNVLLLSTVTTLLFNMNPLMRFDGYYMLSDLIEIPNLAPQGQQYLSYLGRRYLYAVELTPTLEWDAHDVFIKCYGIAAMFWRILITVGIALMAATLFHGAGLVLVAIGAVFWIGVPVFQNLRYFLFGREQERSRRVYCLLRIATAVGLLTMVCLFAPWPFFVKAPAVVDYQAGGIVRTGVGGFVRQVHVRAGESVEQGQLIAELENAELLAEANRLTYALDASKKRIDIASRAGEVSAQLMEQDNRRNLETQLAERKKQLANFQIVAPMSGQIVSGDLEALLGTYLPEGHELLVIGDETQKEIKLSIAQRDAELFTSQIGANVTVKMRGGNHEKLELPIAAVEPGASTSVEYAALTAAAGGSLVVRPKAVADDSQQQWEFVEPRLTGRIELGPEEAKQVRAGQLAMVKLPVSRSKFGTGVYRFAERWLRQRWEFIQRS